MAPQNERRNFFRITDQASLEIRVHTDNDVGFESFFRLPAQYQLISDFQLLDIEAQSLLHGIHEKDRNVGAYLKILNRKLDSLCRTIALLNEPIDPAQVKEINLSEGGLSFQAPASLEPGLDVLMKLILLPSYLGLLLKGRVVTCQQHQDQNQEQYEVHIEFVELDDHQRQLIARHIIRKQQSERRQRQEI